MKISYAPTTTTPILGSNEHQIQIELLCGTQWKKGFTTLTLSLVAGGDRDAREMVSKFLSKNEISVKCPKDRKLSAEITGHLIRLFNPEFGLPEAQVLNGVKQIRVVNKKFVISWFKPISYTASDINYALKA